MSSLQNRVAFVSGGSKGIGLAVVRKLVGLDAEVITCGRKHNHWDDAVHEFPQLSKARFIEADLRDKKIQLCSMIFGCRYCVASMRSH
ncbi:MAG: SDR family NAD(P)-dependent oxidoreductase [Chitinivibrionales bacterium]|nr:SDR family NAD(P)-dependent oxidoreductase [Chitinivibrionales bacterium]